jgi:methylated-DNA-[protein]-cysteine S-methyltransferase
LTITLRLPYDCPTILKEIVIKPCILHTERDMGTIWIGKVTATPLGPAWVAVSEKGLVAVDWDIPQGRFIEKIRRRHGEVTILVDTTRTAEAARQIGECLDGRRRSFDLPIDWSGMGEFQRRALQATLAIPYGQTTTYGKLARQLGKPRAARAVGRAEATNPMPLAIPCHRVLGADGGLCGYGGPGGVKIKQWLLELERMK